MSQSDFSLASYKSQKTADLRNNDRNTVNNWDATVYTDDVISLNSEVEDSSSGGAGLLVSNKQCQITENVELTLTIRTGQQKFTRKAVVRWVQAEGNETRFGVQYVDHVGFTPDSHELDVDLIRIDPACALRIPAGIALRRKVLPFLDMNGVVHVACANVKNITVLNSIERMLKSPICTWEVEPSKLEKILKQIYGSATQQQALPGTAKDKEEDASEAVDLGEKLLYAAYIRQASDIHIDPGFKEARIRFRVDGQLEQYDVIKTEVYVELASRLKVMSGLDIAEKRLPQDGRFSHQFAGAGRRVDIRVATLPTKYGERITMRLLAVQTDSLTLSNLGFTPDHQQLIETFLRRIQGMMILTGPTGSGKTTTLYAAIRMLLEERHVNIITVEDPIEYEIEGVAQCEVDATSEKVDFAKALRSILRHDPDVVMIGEIRDKETADIAIKAALTGHMVFGTLHTNSAAATITRLIDMGVEPYLVAAALRLTVAQRLLRRLCKHCRIQRPLTEMEAMAIGKPELAESIIYEPTGCIYCGNKGFSGRLGLYELMELNPEWARAVAEGEGEGDLLVRMKEAGSKSLLDDAVDKLVSGDTAYAEVLQIAASW